jgi:hypothetical protein
MDEAEDFYIESIRHCPSDDKVCLNFLLPH